MNQMYNGHSLLSIRLALSLGHRVRPPSPAHLQAGRYLPNFCPLCSFSSLSLIFFFMTYFPCPDLTTSPPREQHASCLMQQSSSRMLKRKKISWKPGRVTNTNTKRLSGSLSHLAELYVHIFKDFFTLLN